MSKFNWWRESKVKPKLKRADALKGKSYLLQQIEHGDYDPSPHLTDANRVMKRCELEVSDIKNTWNAGSESLRERVHQIKRKHTKRYNKLMEEFYNSELRTLNELKAQLIIEFGVDVWEIAINSCKGGLKELYFVYEELSQVN